MANAYSILHNYHQDLYSPDYNLIGSVLQYKQGKLDANRQKLQGLYDKLSIIDVAKAEDKEYIEGRLNAAQDIVNKYSAMDLSNDGFANNLIGQLTQTIDDNVRNAVIGTRLYRSEQADWKKLKEDSPEKYSDLNYNYAMQGAQAWLTDGKAGTKYGGGGGTIEFIDLSKKIMENLPDLQKALNAEWVSYGQNEGYFRSLITHQTVSRDKMEEAFTWLFNEKDKRQMGINAWGSYDKMSDEQLRESYDGYFQPRLDKANTQIKNIDVAIASAKTEDEKQQLLANKKLWEKERQALQNNSFDNISANYGREAAYNTLYNRQFKDSILDTYSYDYISDIKVDEVRKANLEYQLKLDEAAEKNRHNKAMEGLKKKELGITDEPFTRGSRVDVPSNTEEGLEGFLGNEYAREDAALDNFTSLVSDKFEEIGLEFEEGDLNSFDVKTQLDNLANKSYITINKDGKEIKIPVKENFNILEDYRNRVLRTSPVKKEAFKSMDSMVTKLSGEMYRGNKHGSSMDLTNLPNYNFEVKEDPKGGFMLVETDKGTNRYQEILSKGKAEGEAENLTRKLYVSLHLLQDPYISDEERRLTTDYVNNLRSQLSSEDAAKISTKKGSWGGTVPNTHGTVPRLVPAGKDFYLNDYTKGDTEAGLLKRLHATAAFYGLVDTNMDDFITGMQKGNDNIIKDGFEGINRAMSEVYGATNELLPESYEYNIGYGAEDYTKLRKKAGIVDPKYKLDMTIQQEFDKQTGQPTNNAILTYATKNTDKETKDKTPYIYTEVSIPKSELAEDGIVVFDTQSYSAYDARVPEYAANIPLGNNSFISSTGYTDGKKNAFKLKNIESGGALAKDYFIFDDGDNQAHALANLEGNLSDESINKIKGQIKAFKAGMFNFNLYPVDGYYQMDISNNNLVTVHSEILTKLDGNTMTPVTTLSSDEVAEVVDDPRYLIETHFLQYLNTIAKEEAVK